MKRIFVIAKNTFRETIRDRILYVILAFGFLFIASTVVLGSISLGEDIKVIRDFGLAGIYFFGLVITLFLGASLMHKEIKERTLYLLLTKPVSVMEVVVGKFLGLFLSVTLATILMALVYLLVVMLKGGGIDVYSVAALILQLAEMSIFIAMAIFFSLLSAPLTAVMYNLCIFYIGHSLQFLLEYGDGSSIFVVRWLVTGIYYVLPNLEKFNIRDLAVYQQGITPQAFGAALLYAAFYSVLLLYISAFVLKRKEI